MHAFLFEMSGWPELNSGVKESVRNQLRIAIKKMEEMPIVSHLKRVVLVVNPLKRANPRVMGRGNQMGSLGIPPPRAQKFRSLAQCKSHVPKALGLYFLVVNCLACLEYPTYTPNRCPSQSC